MSNLTTCVRNVAGAASPDGMSYDALGPLLDCLAEEHDPRWVLLVQVIGRAPQAGKE